MKVLCIPVDQLRTEPVMVIRHSAVRYSIFIIQAISLITFFSALLCGCCRICPPRNVRPIERALLTTGYCKCGECCEWHRNWYGRPVYSNGPNKGEPKKVGVTANGSYARRGTIAADTSKYPFGTVMYIENYGYGRVEDRGRSIKGDHIDLFFRSHRQAVKWGRKKVPVKIWFSTERPVSIDQY